MIKPKSKFDSKKRRSTKRSSSFSFGKKRDSAKTVSRAKQFRLRVSPRHSLLVTARKFKTNKSNRSKQYKQMVIRFWVLPIKELAIRLARLPKTKKPAKTKKLHKTYTVVLRIQPFKVLSYSLMILGILGVGYYSVQISRPKVVGGSSATFSIPTPEPETDFTQHKILPRSLPAKLKITKIGVDVKIINIGRLPNGSMQTPPISKPLVGWYKYSPTPGELGPSIITGHVDGYYGVPSVFWRLHELKPGDKIEITRADKTTAQFKVNSVQNLDQENFPTEKVYGDINHAGLRLITCGGIWESDRNRYSHNTVVFASLIN